MAVSTHLWLAGALIAAVASIDIAAAQEGETIDLFDTARPVRSGLPVDAEALGMMPDTIGDVEFQMISADAGRGLRSGADSRRIRIDLPGNGAVTCDVAARPSLNDVLILSGPADTGDNAEHCYLLVKDGQITGDIQTGSARYRIQPAGSDGTHAVIEMRTEGFPPESDVRVPDLPERKGRSLADLALCDHEGVGHRGTLDIMILYTPAAAARQDMDVLIAEAMSQLQTAVDQQPGDNFGVDVRLVHSQLVDYVESEGMGADLERLSGFAPDSIESVPALRDRYKADIVHMIIEGKGDSCGIGWMTRPGFSDSADYAFSISDRQCAAGNYSFAHEIGHNLGMNHDRYVVEDAGDGDINFGYISPEAQRRTLMAYDHQCREQGVNCPRILGYSTPRQVTGHGTVWGVPLSRSDSAYNREILCRNAPGTAEYR